MADVKWIKIATEVFDNRKIRQIEIMPDGDSILVIWFKLLCLAGNVNDKGLIYFTNEIPYTDQMLAAQFNRPLITIQMALNLFQKYGMIEVIDNIIHVSSWEKYQNVEGMEKIRAQTRERVANYRRKNKELLCNVTSNATVTSGNEADIDRELDKELDKEKKKNNKKKPASADLHDIISSYTSNQDLIQTIHNFIEFRKEIKAKLTQHGLKLALKELDKLAESNDALKIAIINQSIAFGWKGLFSLKQQQQRGNINAKPIATNGNYDSSGLELL